MMPIFNENKSSWLVTLGNRVYSKTLADIWDTDEDDAGIEAKLIQNAVEIVDKENIVGKKYVVAMLLSRLSVCGLHVFCHDVTKCVPKSHTYKPDVCKSPSFRKDFEREISMFHGSMTS